MVKLFRETLGLMDQFGWGQWGCPNNKKKKWGADLRTLHLQ